MGSVIDDAKDVIEAEKLIYEIPTTGLSLADKQRFTLEI